MSDARASYKQGFAHFASGEVDEAITAYREAVATDPALAIAWNGLSIVLAQKGEFDEAVAAARTLVELEPDDALSHTNLSRILMQRGSIPEAEDEKAVAMQLQMKQQSKT
jgi:Flp pilus assembly protein TadD